MVTKGETISDREIIDDELLEIDLLLTEAKADREPEAGASLRVARAILLLARLFTPRPE